MIFASSLLAFPQTFAGMFEPERSWAEAIAAQLSVRACRCTICCYVAGIIFFCFFYVSIIFNPNEAADNMRKYGGFIPGIRPGKNTAEYMNRF